MVHAVALYGDEAVVDHRFAKIKRAFERIEGAEVTGKKCAPQDIPKLEHPAERIQGGVPNLRRRDPADLRAQLHPHHDGHLRHEDEAQTRSAYDVCRRLVTEAAKLGYGEYGAHLDFMDLASEQYSFNHHAYRRFCETIKDAVDPQGILARQAGIWPAASR